MEQNRKYVFLRRTLKWIWRLALSVFIILCAILVFFSGRTEWRENKTIHEAAPASGHFIQASDVKIFYQEAGSASGTPVLLIHGTGAWSEIWRETMDSLAKAGFHAIAIDVPPFGYSEKPNGVQEYARQKQAQRIIGVLDSLKIKSAVLVGHSVGARPTIEAALENPSRISKLILVDPALGFQDNSQENLHFEQNDPSWLVRAVFSIKPLRTAILSVYSTNPALIKRSFSSFVLQKEAVTSERVKMLQQPLVVKNTTNAYGDWLESLFTAHDDSLASDFSNFKNLSMPVDIIWGSSDTITPLWQGEQLRKLIPNSQLAVINDVGHIPYIENTEEFNKTLLEFLAP